MGVSALLCGCNGAVGNGSGKSTGGTNPPPQQSVAAPTITSTAAQNGAMIVSLADSNSGATVYYTLDGSAPTTSSQQYMAPILIASNLTVKAFAAASGSSGSSITSKDFSLNIPTGTLVWSDEFTNSGNSNMLPDSKTWVFTDGFGGFENNELETYCAAGSSKSPCDPNNPNAYIDPAGILHIVGRNPSGTTYTSARMKTERLFSFMYGRIEARMKLPESQGLWPAFWLLGNSVDVTSIDWPACGELDVMEHIDGNNPPPTVGAQPPGYDWVQGSVHGTNLNGGIQYHPSGFSAADWHTYGMIWTKGQIQYYVDSPSNVYATFTSSTQGGTWPFDQGPEFILLNLAIGGSWPGNPNATTIFPADMQVDYVRIYTN